MSLFSPLSLSKPELRSTPHLSPPAWVSRLSLGWRELVTHDDLSMRVARGSDFCLVEVIVRGARSLSSPEFEARTAQAYGRIAAVMAEAEPMHPVRFWNHIPGIHAPGDNGTDRYMAFNAGRFAAYSRWLGGAKDFDRTVPTASAVGHDGDDLVIHALGSLVRGVAIANPRQIAPYRYSRRFGPLPPCFARATMLPGALEGRPTVLVGGTASIRGEESVHVGNLASQIDETFENLACLIRAALAEPSQNINGLSREASRRWLGCFEELRVYFVRDKDLPEIQRAVGAAFAASCRVEYVRADLCRADLLVEIEGLASG